MLGLLFAMCASQEPPISTVPLPSANQMAWHARQYYAFVHFGPNTFSGNEWGHGDEDPSSFNPTALDCRQWARTFKQAGMSGVIITAKHHDGFALWPSKFTKHSVASSKWRGGGGDVLKELSKACKEYGLWMGVYLSPWDRNHPSYGTDAYNDVFVGMLKEVLTSYGDIKEVWFDGANGEGPNGKRQVYDWERYEATVRKFAPNAVIFGDGGDVRWVGNESGFVGETNWNFLPSGHWPGDQSIYDKLFEGDPVGDKYSPAECDVSIRPGWFWRASENSRVKSLEQLKEIFYRSIGHGGNLLLNVPPDTRGLIHETDVAALIGFKKWRDATFGENVAKRAKTLAVDWSKPETQQPAKRAADGRLSTVWRAGAKGDDALISLLFEKPQLIDHVVLQESVGDGQKVKEFRIGHFKKPGEFTVLAEGTTIGYKRVVKFPATPVDYLTIEATAGEGTGPVAVAEVQAYLGAPEVTIVAEEPIFMGSTEAVLKCDNPQATVRYTLDGSEPTSRSAVYQKPIRIDKSCTLKARGFYGKKSSANSAALSYTKYEVGDLLPPTVFIKAPEPGLSYRYIEQGWQTLDQMKGAEATSFGVCPGLDLGVRRRDEHFGIEFEGVVTASKMGLYTFYLSSDDGSRLYIDDQLTVDNDGLHGMQEKVGVVGLHEGYHRIRVQYFNAAGGLGLKLLWKGPSFGAQEMTASDFKH